jgi:hypothetical protein
MAMSSQSTEDIDFFVSYIGKDQTWAEWISWQLEANRENKGTEA